MGTKAAVDTNVLISALGWEGNERRILRMIFSAEVELVMSEALIIELSDVLNYPKLAFTQEEKSEFKELVLKRVTLVQPTESIAVLNDGPDNRILECAVAGKADIIITGDKALRELSIFRGIKIKTAKEFLE